MGVLWRTIVQSARLPNLIASCRGQLVAAAAAAKANTVASAVLQHLCVDPSAGSQLAS